GQVADPYLFVKYAVRYKGAEETVAMRAWPLDAASAAEVFDAQELAVEESKLETAVPAGVRFTELPAYTAARSGRRGLEKASKRTVSGAGTVLSKTRMEGTAE